MLYSLNMIQTLIVQTLILLHYLATIQALQQQTLIIGDDDFDKGQSTTINDVRLMAWCNRFKQYKACKNQQRINTILCVIVGGRKIGNFWGKKTNFI